MTKHMSERDARLHLSSIIEDVIHGEEVIIDRRGRSVARITCIDAPMMNEKVEVVAETLTRNDQVRTTKPDLDSSMDEFINHFWF